MKCCSEAFVEQCTQNESTEDKKIVTTKIYRLWNDEKNTWKNTQHAAASHFIF